MKATGALASLDSDFLLPYATHLVRSTASTSSSNCLEWSTRCLISMTRRGSLTAALTYLSKCSVKLDGMSAPRSATSCCLTRSRTAAQTMAPAVTAVVTTCQFDRRNSLTAMLGRVRRGPITPWNALDGNPKARMVIKMAVPDVSSSLQAVAQRVVLSHDGGEPSAPYRAFSRPRSNLPLRRSPSG